MRIIYLDLRKQCQGNSFRSAGVVECSFIEPVILPCTWSHILLYFTEALLTLSRQFIGTASCYQHADGRTVDGANIVHIDCISGGAAEGGRTFEESVCRFVYSIRFADWR